MAGLDMVDGLDRLDAEQLARLYWMVKVAPALFNVSQELVKHALIRNCGHETFANDLIEEFKPQSHFNCCLERNRD